MKTAQDGCKDTAKAQFLTAGGREEEFARAKGKAAVAKAGDGMKVCVEEALTAAGVTDFKVCHDVPRTAHGRGDGSSAPSVPGGWCVVTVAVHGADAALSCVIRLPPRSR